MTSGSKKQKVVVLSSVEAEFRGIAKGITEVLWIRKLLIELSFKQHNNSELNCDNKATISISENPVQHDRTKHVEVDQHFIKEKLEAKIINIPFVRSKEQLAYILTKAVGLDNFKTHYASWVLKIPLSNLRGVKTNNLEQFQYY